MRKEKIQGAHVRKEYRRSARERSPSNANPRLVLSVVLVLCLGVLKFMPQNTLQQTVHSTLHTTVDLSRLMADLRHVIASHTVGRPVFHLPISGEITSPYGQRNHPVTGEPSLHTGIDIPAPEGTVISASREGTVSKIYEDPSYGICMLLSHPDGYETFYAHLQEAKAQTGTSVAQGEEIALSGNTGVSTGPHLHFEIRKDGTAVDPRDYLVK